MTEPNRRDALGHVCGAGLAALLAAAPGTLADPVRGKAGAKRELFIVGPFLLGDWYKMASKSHQIGDWFLKGAGIDANEVIKTLNKNRVFIIDERVREGAKKVRFSDGDYPAAAVAGDLKHEWTNKDGKKFVLRVVKMEFVAPSTDEGAGLQRRRSTLVGFAFRLDGDFGLVSRSDQSHFMLEDAVQYDVNGKPFIE